MADSEQQTTTKPFGCMKRDVPSTGVNALTGKGGGVVKDGTYYAHQFLLKEEPAHVAVSYKWIEKGLMDNRDVGYLVLDNEWDFVVPVVHANRYNVQYYGMRLDPLPQDIDVESAKVICNNGGMYDFNYTDAYEKYLTERDGQQGTGGCRIERHQFSHVETPLSREPDSGVFVAGIEDKETGKLHLTAFIIAYGQTLYVPPRTIHTNDYQRGLWRTYLEIGDIDICDLVKKGDVINESHEPSTILLKFECAVTKKRMSEYELGIVVEDDDDEKIGMNNLFSPVSNTITKMKNKLKKMTSVEYIRKTVFESRQSTEDWKLEQTANRVHQNYADMQKSKTLRLAVFEGDYDGLFDAYDEFEEDNTPTPATSGLQKD